MTAQSINQICRSLSWSSKNNTKTYETSLPSKRDPNNPRRHCALKKVEHGSQSSVNTAVHAQLPSKGQCEREEQV